MVDMICEIDEKYRDYVHTNKKGNKVLVGEMNKAVYGNCLSGLIFYNKLADFLRDEGYSCNPYDKCT